MSYSDKVALDFTDRSFRSVLFGQSCTRLYGQELSLCLIRTKLNSTLRTGSFVVSHTDKVALDFTDRIVRCVLSGQSCARLCQQDPSQYHPDKVAVDVTDRILRSVIRTRLLSTLQTGSFVVSFGQGCTGLCWRVSHIDHGLSLIHISEPTRPP